MIEVKVRHVSRSAKKASRGRLKKKAATLTLLAKFKDDMRQDRVETGSYQEARELLLELVEITLEQAFPEAYDADPNTVSGVEDDEEEADDEVEEEETEDEDEPEEGDEDEDEEEEVSAAEAKRGRSRASAGGGTRKRRARRPRRS